MDPITVGAMVVGSLLVGLFGSSDGEPQRPRSGGVEPPKLLWDGQGLRAYDDKGNWEYRHGSY